MIKLIILYYDKEITLANTQNTYSFHIIFIIYKGKKLSKATWYNVKIKESIANGSKNHYPL